MFPFAFCFCLVLFGVWVVGVCFLLCLCFSSTTRCDDLARATEAQDGKKT